MPTAECGAIHFRDQKQIHQKEKVPKESKGQQANNVWERKYNLTSADYTEDVTLEQGGNWDTI